MRIRLLKDDKGEPRVWSHGTSRSAKQGKAWWRNYRWWLHGPNNWCFHTQWVIERSAGATLLFSLGEGDGPETKLVFGLPWLFTIYLVLEWNALRRFVRTVGTKRYKGGDWDMPITREIGFRVFDGRIWFSLWSDPHDSSHHKRWQEFNWGPANFFLGRPRHWREDEREYTGEVVLPEGSYPATITLYTACRKRPRWPRIDRWPRSEVEIESGIPIPGKGENSWDCGDNAIYGISSAQETVEEALAACAESILHTRLKYGGPDWTPVKGWGNEESG